MIHYILNLNMCRVNMFPVLLLISILEVLLCQTTTPDVSCLNQQFSIIFDQVGLQAINYRSRINARFFDQMISMQYDNTNQRISLKYFRKIPFGDGPCISKRIEDNRMGQSFQFMNSSCMTTTTTQKTILTNPCIFREILTRTNVSFV
ncbi:uncharacterized protein LOC134257549 [Saccostrea cucullata]|uniref:uncharacterized protein LOC134257549 n=1 Tax=Saccostrea cuccullata TaxID=36930 RepID=UPI002ED0A51D